MTADRWSDLMALLAGVVGLFVMLLTWPRLPRRAQVARLRHPSAPVPVGVELDTSGDTAHWRVSTSAASVPTTVDILIWRPVGSVDDWHSEPIVEPLVLEPGESAVLPLVVDDPTSAHLVVVAWTVRHPGGDVQGSRTLTIGTTSSTVPAAAPASRRWALLGAAALVTGLLVVLVLVAGWRVLDGDADGSASPTHTTVPIIATVPIIPTVPMIEPAVDPTAPPAVATSTSARSQTTTSAGSPPATITSTIPASTTAPTTATTIPSTPSTSTAATTGPDGRTIELQGRVEDCRFGADCVIVSFAAVGFPDEGDYVCEFADRSRVTFRYAGGGAIDACAASGDQPSITIEIDGVRSPTMTREALEGA